MCQSGDTSSARPKTGGASGKPLALRICFPTWIVLDAWTELGLFRFPKSPSVAVFNLPATGTVAPVRPSNETVLRTVSFGYEIVGGRWSLGMFGDQTKNKRPLQTVPTHFSGSGVSWSCTTQPCMPTSQTAFASSGSSTPLQHSVYIVVSACTNVSRFPQVCIVGVRFLGPPIGE